MNLHGWLVMQTKLANNIFPIRKTAKYSNRGEIHVFPEGSFLPVDNELLASLMNLVLLKQLPDMNMSQCLKNGLVSASWKCDIYMKPDFKFKGIKSSFRDNGLKLAHIYDAAKGLESTRFDKDGILKE